MVDNAVKGQLSPLQIAVEEDDENVFDTTSWNDGVPLNKTDSLWMSISNETVLPSADHSVSLKGLPEAEKEIFL